MPTPVIAPPYPAHTLRPPLTKAQRDAIFTYIRKYANTSDSGASDAFALADITGKPYTDLLSSSLPGSVNAAVLNAVKAQYDAGQFDAGAIASFDIFASGGAEVPAGYGNDTTKQFTPSNALPGWTESLKRILANVLDKNFWLRALEIWLGLGLILVALGHSIIGDAVGFKDISRLSKAISAPVQKVAK